MKNRKKIEGIIPAMVTPFKESQELDLVAAAELTEWLIQKGVHGLFIAGTNGEAHLLSDQEIVKLTKTVVKAAKGRVPIFSGAGRCGTLATIALAKQLKEAGADYISLVTPYYLVPNQHDLYLHYKAIAEAVDADFLLYNIPSQTGLTIETSTANALADIDNIIGIKDSGGDFGKQKEYIAIGNNKNFVVLNGSDSLMLKSFEAGAVASVAATANILAELEVELYQHFKNNDHDAAQASRDKMDMLRMNLKKGVAPSVMKKTMNMMGIPVGTTRKPVQEPEGKILEDIEVMLQYYGFSKV